MSTYKVDDISKILDVNEETVRRWIRADKLHATKKSKRQGYIVEGSDFEEFLNNHPKYRKKYGKHRVRVHIRRATKAFKSPEFLEMFIK